MATNTIADDTSDATEDIFKDLVVFEPQKDLSEIGLYSYNSLCAYALGKLYGNSDTDRSVIEKWIKMIAEHNGCGNTATDTMLAMATDQVNMENADPFVDEIVSDPKLREQGPILLTKDLLRLVLKEGCYDARLRTMIKYMSLLLRVDWNDMEHFEDSVVTSLHDEEHEPSQEELSEQKSKSKKRKIKSYLLIGAAAVGGGTLLGLTGGLAAPFIAAGAGVLIGGAGAAALGSVAGVAIIGSLFGVAGVGLGGYKMKKRVGGVEEFEFEPLGETRQLHVTIAVSGWISEKMPDMKLAWLGLANSKEQYVLKYETKYMMEMGKALEYLMGIAITAATQQALQFTVLSGLLTAIAWPAALLSASNVIDNPWHVCTHRAVNVGKQLADVLLTRQQGKRPVTLIGFSLGARVIFYCLQELAKRKNCEGIVEDVIMLGAPVTGNPKEWQPLARVVAGKIVNGYCRGDWLLKFLYRTASVQFSIAGLKPVPWQDRRMHNIDLSDVVQGHLDYMHKIDDILGVVGIHTKDHPPVGRHAESLRDWVKINKSTAKQDTSKLKSHGSSRETSSIPSSASGSVANMVVGSRSSSLEALASDVGDHLQLDDDTHKSATPAASESLEMTSERAATGSHLDSPERASQGPVDDQPKVESADVESSSECSPNQLCSNSLNQASEICEKQPENNNTDPVSNDKHNQQNSSTNTLEGDRSSLDELPLRSELTPDTQGIKSGSILPSPTSVNDENSSLSSQVTTPDSGIITDENSEQ